MTRRDFFNAVLLGSGVSLLKMPAPLAADPGFDGPGGVGDYAAANGNTWEVLEAAHRIRDGEYQGPRLEAADTGERFDLAVIGGGMSGLGAALDFLDRSGPERTCLVLDNHPIFGGVSKRNEFLVDGLRLMAPQGANEFDIPVDPSGDDYEIFERLKIPREFEYAPWPGDLRRLEFDRTNYGYQYWLQAPSFGHLIDGRWVRDYWKRHAPEALRRWVQTRKRYYDGEDWPQWLDSMTYRDYIEKVMGLPREAADYIDPVLAAAMGLGSDALSAYAAYQVSMPGFRVWSGWGDFPAELDKVPENTWHMFPGGNTGLARYLVKALIPEAVRGGHGLEDVVNGRVRFGALDREGNRVRIRLGATAVRVRQENDGVTVVYERGGRLLRFRAAAVVMACGTHVARHIVEGLPEEKRQALDTFLHSPMLTVNVAVRHWRFLYERGISSARWFEGFGFATNVRPPMWMPGYRPPFHPDRPTVLTFYVPFYYPGLPAREQGMKGRMDLLSTSYAEYEEKIRNQMRRLFGEEAVKAIAGIILNRWGHAFVNATPGFYYGRDGRPAPRDVVRRPLGRIAFAHSELNGHQFWLGAIREGRRAVRDLEDYYRAGRAGRSREAGKDRDKSRRRG